MVCQTEQIGACRTVPVANRYGLSIRFRMLAKLDQERRKERKKGEEGRRWKGRWWPAKVAGGAPRPSKLHGPLWERLERIIGREGKEGKHRDRKEVGRLSWLLDDGKPLHGGHGFGTGATCPYNGFVSGLLAAFLSLHFSPSPLSL